MMNFRMYTRSRDLTLKHPHAEKVFSFKVKVALNLVNSLADIS